MDHNYLVPNFFHLSSQYEYNTELILTELILCSKLLQPVFMDRNFVFKFLQKCIHNMNTTKN